MSEPVRRSLSWVPTAAAFLALLSTGNGGCDWFKGPVEANFEPDTEMVTEPTDDHAAGDDVLVEWSGSDPDGTVDRYRWEWMLDDALVLGSGDSDSTRLILRDVARGRHRFEVAAVDDDGDADATPAACEFVVELVPRVVLAEFITGRGCPKVPIYPASVIPPPPRHSCEGRNPAS